MNDVAIRLEHVDLLNGLDGLSVQLLQGGLELLVVVGATGDIASLLLSGSSLAACNDQSIICFLNRFEASVAQHDQAQPVNQLASQPAFPLTRLAVAGRARN